MNRKEVLNILRTHKPTLAERFGVTELALFGSFARAEAAVATKPRHLQLADLRRIRSIRPRTPRNPAFGRVEGENGLAESPKRASEMSEGVEGPAPLRTRRPRCGDTAAKALPAIWTTRGTMPWPSLIPSAR